MRSLAAFARATLLPVTFDWSAPLLVAVGLVLAYDPSASSMTLAADLLVTLLAIGLGLFAHEWSHAAATDLAGGRVTRVHIHGFGANVDVAGVASHQQGAVIAAGPVMNLSLASAAGLGSFLLGGAAGDALATLAGWNALLGVANLLPLGTSDGGILARLGPKARVARGSAWTMAGVLALTYVAAVLMLAGGAVGLLFGLAVVLGGCVGAWCVGWHGVLPPLREARNEWGDVIA